MTVKEWFGQELLVQSYSEHINSDVVRVALDILVKEFLPKANIPGNSENYMERNALLNARREGYFDFYRNLMALTEVPSASSGDQKESEPWQYIQQD